MNGDNTPIKVMDITVKTKNVLTALGFSTKKDIYVFFLMELLPKVGTVITHYPYVDVELVYSNEVNEEIKSILNNDFKVSIQELEILN